MKRKLLLIFALFCGLVSAQPLENFNFSGSLNTNGWTMHSGIAGQFQTLATPSDNGNSLSFSGLELSSANRAAYVPGNTEDVNKAISGITGSGYFSFLLKVSNTTGLTTTGEYFTGFGNTAGASVTVFGARTFIKAGLTPNTFQLGIQNTTGGTPTQTYDPIEYPVGTTVLVVVKLDASVAPINASIYVNPIPGGIEPAASASNNTGTATFANFASVILRQNGTISNGTGNLEIDEIRAGSTWASVTPPSAVSCDTYNSFSVTQCTSYTVPSGDETHFVDGVYFDTIPNAALCDSFLTITVDITTGITYYADIDVDTYGDPNNTTTACTQPVGYVVNSSDCNDNDPLIGPATTTYYQDFDGDTYGSPTNTIVACTMPIGYLTDNTDCNDNNINIHPGALDTLDNGIDEDCNGSDASAAGTQIGLYEFTQAAACPVTALSVTAQPIEATFSDYSSVNTTCSPAGNVFSNSGWNLTSNVDLTEYNQFSVSSNGCNSMDLNKIIFTHRISASGGTPTWRLRSSLDNYSSDLASGTPLTTDKTDTVILGALFDAVTNVTFRYYITNMGASGSTWRNDNVRVIANFGILTPTTWYPDNDGDGYGDVNTVITACQAPPNYVADASDCNDADPSIKPGGIEVCDGVDNDCDGLFDDQDPSVTDQTAWYEDSDNDGFGSSASAPILSCTGLAGYVADGSDCDDTEASIYPGAPELCDGLDNDCDAVEDDGLTFVNYYTDADNDGFGIGSPTPYCSNPGAGYSLVATDCNDATATIYPGATEVQGNMVDENCDGVDGYLSIDENSIRVLNVYPNPSNGLFVIELNQNNSGSTITILDLNGKNVYSTDFSETSFTCDLSSITNGTYILKILSESNTIQHRIVIQK